MYRHLLCLLAFLPLGAELVDRIAITVDRQVITELQIDEELRVTAFLNHVPVSRDIESRRAAADRMVAQVLVAREMQISRYQPAAADKTDEYLAQIRATFKTDIEYRAGLVAYGISEPSLRQHLATQLNTLSFIEIRFRPNLDIPDSEVENYYAHQVASWKTEHPNVPEASLADSRPAILKALTKEHTNQILDIWLEEARKQVSIAYRDKELQ
jgi:hypothetical protein